MVNNNYLNNFHNNNNNNTTEKFVKRAVDAISLLIQYQFSLVCASYYGLLFMSYSTSTIQASQTGNHTFRHVTPKLFDHFLLIIFCQMAVGA